METSDAGSARASVYLETSIVSYLTARASRDLLVAAHQQLTVAWWDQQRASYELFTSQVVLAEARAGDAEAAQRRLTVLERLPLLDVTDAAIALAATLITEQALPAQATQDALHLALTGVHGMEYLLTWNCTHLANARLRGRIEQVCREAGYVTPIIPEDRWSGGSFVGVGDCRVCVSISLCSTGADESDAERKPTNAQSTIQELAASEINNRQAGSQVCRAWLGEAIM